MLDIKLIRQDPEAFEKKLKTKIPDIDIFKILSLDDEIRKIQSKTDDIRYIFLISFHFSYRS